MDLMYHLLHVNPSPVVPQGSVLGPLLFLLYVNDLPNHVQSPAGIKIFADDTKLYLGYTENQNTYAILKSIFCSWSKTSAPDPGICYGGGAVYQRGGNVCEAV